MTENYVQDTTTVFAERCLRIQTNRHIRNRYWREGPKMMPLRLGQKNLFERLFVNPLFVREPTHTHTTTRNGAGIVHRLYIYIYICNFEIACAFRTAEAVRMPG